jgi:hypothetical protein
MESRFVKANMCWESDNWMFYQVIRSRHLKLTTEIGSGPGYFLHAGEAKGRAVIVKVFNAGPTVLEVCIRNTSISSSEIYRRNWNRRWLCRKGLCVCTLSPSVTCNDCS